MPTETTKDSSNNSGGGQTRRELVNVADMNVPGSKSNNNETALAASADSNNNGNNDNDNDIDNDSDAVLLHSPSRNTRLAKAKRRPSSSSEEDNDDDVDVDAMTDEWKKAKKAAKKPKKKATKKNDKNESASDKKERQLNWIKQKKIGDVELTDDKTTVHAIAGAPWASMKAYVKKQFLITNDIKIPGDSRKSCEYGKIVANHLKAQQYTGSMKSGAGGKKKTSDTKRPSFVTKEGTYYRLIEVITATVLRVYFQETLIPFDRANLDAVKKNTVVWEKLHSSYADAELYKKIARYEAILGCGVGDSICAEFDELDVEMFQEVTKYILAMYRSARNKKSLSGNHKQFSDYVGGNVWLLYLHTKLEEIGDTSLKHCFFAELPSDALRSSSSQEYVAYGKPPSSNKKKARTSRSPSPTDSSENPTKATSQSAIKAASDAIRKSHESSLKMKQREMLASLNRQSASLKSKLAKYKKYKNLPTGDDRREIMKLKYKTIKKEWKYVEAQRNELKEELNYESPVDSSDSSADEKEDSNMDGLV